MCPTSEHCICVKHLYANLKNEDRREVLLKDLLWQVASFYTKAEFHAVMGDSKKISKDAHDYLSMVYPNT